MAFNLTEALAQAGKHVFPGGVVSLQGLSLLAVQTSSYFSGKKASFYNLLWVLVFGFATLNILGMITRRLEPRRSNLHFSEIIAITVVVVAVFLLGSEMLYLFHVLPIKLQPR
jgi:hypothetical protein